MENLEKNFKIFLIENEPYLTISDNLIIGDLAIVTYNDNYASLVKCVNNEQINLFQNSKLSMTKSYKVILKPNQINLELEDLNKIKNIEGVINVEYVNGIITIL